MVLCNTAKIRGQQSLVIDVALSDILLSLMNYRHHCVYLALNWGIVDWLQTSTPFYALPGMKRLEFVREYNMAFDG